MLEAQNQSPSRTLFSQHASAHINEVVDFGPNDGAQCIAISQSSELNSDQVLQMNPVLHSNSMIPTNPVLHLNPVIKTHPVLHSNPMIQTNPVLHSNPVIQANTVLQTKPSTKSSWKYRDYCKSWGIDSELHACHFIRSVG